MALVKVKAIQKSYVFPEAASYSGHALGCDPEFFITNKKGEVVGSEKILDIDKPLITTGLYGGSVIVDGVQAEINPTPTACRANLANSIVNCFQTLQKRLGTDKNLTTSFKNTVEISQEKLNELNEKSRQFGCAPSLNGYTSTTSVIPVKGDEYLKRSAGGHIHIGIGDRRNDAKLVQRLTYLMDIFVGIPSVLLDRDPGNIERRRIYGRAGEYRLPPHGYEYRTLSNFWLRGYPIMSLVFGLTKIATWIAQNTEHTNRTYSSSGIYEYIMDTVDLKEVERAINTNDFNLALKIFIECVEPVLENCYVNSTWDNLIGISHTSLPKFYTLVLNGIDKYWPLDRDIVDYWARLPDAHDGGIHSWYFNNCTTIEQMAAIGKSIEMLAPLNLFKKEEEVVSKSSDRVKSKNPRKPRQSSKTQRTRD